MAADLSLNKYMDAAERILQHAHSNPLKALGCSNAGDAARCYKSLLLLVHPDKAQGVPFAREAFEALQAAYAATQERVTSRVQAREQHSPNPWGSYVDSHDVEWHGVGQQTERTEAQQKESTQAKSGRSAQRKVWGQSMAGRVQPQVAAAVHSTQSHKAGCWNAAVATTAPVQHSKLPQPMWCTAVSSHGSKRGRCAIPERPSRQKGQKQANKRHHTAEQTGLTVKRKRLKQALDKLATPCSQDSGFAQPEWVALEDSDAEQPDENANSPSTASECEQPGQGQHSGATLHLPPGADRRQANEPGTRHSSHNGSDRDAIDDSHMGSSEASELEDVGCDASESDCGEDDRKAASQMQPQPQQQWVLGSELQGRHGRTWMTHGQPKHISIPVRAPATHAPASGYIWNAKQHGSSTATSHGWSITELGATAAFESVQPPMAALSDIAAADKQCTGQLPAAICNHLHQGGTLHEQQQQHTLDHAQCADMKPQRKGDTLVLHHLQAAEQDLPTRTVRHQGIDNCHAQLLQAGAHIGVCRMLPCTRADSNAVAEQLLDHPATSGQQGCPDATDHCMQPGFVSEAVASQHQQPSGECCDSPDDVQNDCGGVRHGQVCSMVPELTCDSPPDPVGTADLLGSFLCKHHKHTNKPTRQTTLPFNRQSSCRAGGQASIGSSKVTRSVVHSKRSSGRSSGACVSGKRQASLLPLLLKPIQASRRKSGRADQTR